jgi:hypothetical protein
MTRARTGLIIHHEAREFTDYPHPRCPFLSNALPSRSFSRAALRISRLGFAKNPSSSETAGIWYSRSEPLPTVPIQDLMLCNRHADRIACDRIGRSGSGQVSRLKISRDADLECRSRVANFVRSTTGTWRQHGNPRTDRVSRPGIDRVCALGDQPMADACAFGSDVRFTGDAYLRLCTCRRRNRPRRAAGMTLHGIRGGPSTSPQPRHPGSMQSRASSPSLRSGD